MTYGRSCSKNSVSNDRLHKSTGGRRGRNLRSLGASGGALVPRVPRDTHLDGLCRRRFELAEKFVINLTCGPGRVASRFRKNSGENWRPQIRDIERRPGHVGESNSHLDMAYLCWSLVERLCKGGMLVRDRFWKMWVKLFGWKLGRCRCVERSPRRAP
jgi:hypothetical protein